MERRAALGEVSVPSRSGFRSIASGVGLDAFVIGRIFKPYIHIYACGVPTRGHTEHQHEEEDEVAG